jgi:ABC-type nickel/cobalt efflux system permease component RcnA
VSRDETFGSRPDTAGRLAPARHARLLQLGLAVGALLLIGLVLVALGFGLHAWLTPPPAPRSPFGTGLMETAPAATGIGAIILNVQSEFYQALIRAVQALKQDGAAFWTLLAIGFIYGIFHAAGPGHGKSVISGYIVASRQSLKRGLILSGAAAVLQALVAIVIVTALAVILKATAASISATARAIELTSFAVVIAVGLVVLWRKAGSFLAVIDRTRFAETAPSHVHIPPPAALDRLRHWREMAGVVLAAGIRPCSGAIIILVFALAQGLFAAGLAATLAMAVGTALTTGALAALAVFMKSLALTLAGGRSRGPVLVAGLEVLAAAFVALTGVALLLGLWATGGS